MAVDRAKMVEEALARAKAACEGPDPFDHWVMSYGGSENDAAVLAAEVERLRALLASHEIAPKAPNS